MEKAIQALYTELTREDRDKVDAKIRELFAKQKERFAAEDCSKTNTVQ